MEIKGIAHDPARTDKHIQIRHETMTEGDIDHAQKRR
jgi:hypothetical protein